MLVIKATSCIALHGYFRNEIFRNETISNGLTHYISNLFTSLSFKSIGSILYPELKEKMPETVTQNSFKGEYVKRPDAIRLSESNIKMEGNLRNKCVIILVNKC